MKLDKEPKPYYITVVSHFQMSPSECNPQDYMCKEFKKFDEKVNEKIAEGYVPYGNFVMDHCDMASMDLAQTMILENK